MPLDNDFLKLFKKNNAVVGFFKGPDNTKTIDEKMKKIDQFVKDKTIKTIVESQDDNDSKNYLYAILEQGSNISLVFYFLNIILEKSLDDFYQLIEANCQVSDDFRYRTPLDYAIQNNMIDVVTYILQNIKDENKKFALLNKVKVSFVTTGPFQSRDDSILPWLVEDERYEMLKVILGSFEDQKVKITDIVDIEKENPLTRFLNITYKNSFMGYLKEEWSIAKNYHEFKYKELNNIMSKYGYKTHETCKETNFSSFLGVLKGKIYPTSKDNQDSTIQAKQERLDSNPQDDSAESFQNKL